MKRSLSVAVLAFVVLTGCSANNDASDTGQSSVGAPSPQVYQDVQNWSGAGDNGAQFTATAEVKAPSGVEEARKLMGKSDTPLHFLAVTVDNIKGADSITTLKATFTTPAGDLVEYTALGDYLNESEAPESSSVDATNRIIEVHNAFSWDEYEVIAGQKKTVVLATESAYPRQVTHATVGEGITLTPSDRSAETDKATGAPEAKVPVGSNDRLAELYGTTLKGNDINFRIFSPNAQKELNAVMPPQLNGAWGALCSHAATKEQLMETGANASGHNWRPFQYAVTESGAPPLSGDAKSKEYEAASLAELSHGGSCAVIQSPDTSAATKTSVASVGHYLGNSTLEATVDVR